MTQKNAYMTRISAREIAVQILFSHSFLQTSTEELLTEWLDASFYERMAGEDALYERPPGKDAAGYIERLVTGVTAHNAQLDETIRKYAVGWELNRIPRTTLHVLQVAMFEVLFMPDVPPAAAINAAVDISKRYDSPEVVSFVNGILGSFMRTEVRTETAEADTAAEQPSGAMS